MPPAAGIVRIHAQIIFSTTVHLIALKRLAVPTPMIADEMLCVVETGMPSADAAMITDAALVSAAKPLIGCSFTSLWPSVLMMRQPPAAVPAAITMAQVNLIQRSMSLFSSAFREGCRNASHDGRLSSVPADCAPTSASAMMPIVFCASFMPCAKPMPAADTSCALPKNAFTQRGRAMRARKPPLRAMREMIANSSPITTKPAAKPSSGEENIGTTTFHSTPALLYQGSPGCDQITEWKLLFAAATAAPQRPPISACEDEDGRPFHHVIRFDTIAPSSAHRISCEVTSTTPVSSRPEAIVLATAVPHNAPSRLVIAASITAWIGESTLVA